MVNKDYAEQIKRGKELAEENIKTAIEDAGKNEEGAVEEPAGDGAKDDRAGVPGR